MFAFFSALVVGAAGILVARVVDGTITSLSVTAIAMTAYLVWVIRQHAVGEYKAGLADSFYYLGFILTLIAFGSSLIGMSQYGDHRLGELLHRFGVGLLTTLYGLAGRIALTQFQAERGASAESIEHQIERSASQLAYEIEKSIGRFATTTETIDQLLRGQQERMSEAISRAMAVWTDATESARREIDGLQDGLRSLEHAMQDTSKRVPELVEKKVAAGVQPAVDALGESLEGARVKLTASLDALAGGIATIGGQLTLVARDVGTGGSKVSRAFDMSAQAIATMGANAAKRIDAINLPVDRLTSGIDASSQQLRAAIEGVAENVASAATRLNTELNSVKVPADILVDALGEVAQALTALILKIHAAFEQFPRLLDDVSNGFRHLNQTTGNIAAGSQAVGDAIDQLKATVPAMGDAVRSVSSLANSISSLSGATSVAVRAIEDQSVTASALVQAQLESIKGIAEQLSNAVAEATRATERVHRNLARNANFIVERLGK